MEQGGEILWTKLWRYSRARFCCADYALGVLHACVRSEICFDVEADFEDACQGWIDIERAFCLSSKKATGKLIVDDFRISCIVMTLKRQKMVWEEKKVHFVCVRCGAWRRWRELVRRMACFCGGLYRCLRYDVLLPFDSQVGLIWFLDRTFCCILTMSGCALKKFPSRVKRACLVLKWHRDIGLTCILSLGNAVQGFTCVAFVDFLSSIVLIVCFLIKACYAHFGGL